MLNRIMKTIFRTLFRLVLLLAGLVFMFSLLLAGLLWLAMWLARAAWARLTGQPVQPWTFQINRHAAWSRYHHRSVHRHAPPADDANVIDAEIKEVKLPGRSPD